MTELEKIAIIEHFEIELSKYNENSRKCNNKGLRTIYAKKARMLNLLLNMTRKQIREEPIAFKRTAYNFETGICPYSHYECEHIIPYNHEYEYTDYKCPSCNKRLSDGKPDYCCHCGQALDWK